VLLQVPIQSDVPRHGTPKIWFTIADGSGSSLGEGRVVKYGIGPRSKKATVAVTDAQGNEVVRVEPADKKGEQLTITTDGNEVASIGVSEVKAGFMRKSRVYSVQISGSIAQETRPLAFAAAIRYDGVIEAVASAAMSQSVRD
jgi:hypothetical protein